MNRNIERGSATRQRLLTVAEKLFVEHGFEHTSTESILREAGVSRGSLYHHFPGKEALFWGVLERADERVAAKVAAATDTEPDPMAKLRAGCLAWIGLATEPDVHRLMLIDAPAVLGWRRWREVNEQHSLGGIRNALAVAAEAGRLPTDQVDMFAHIVLAAINEVAQVIAHDPTDDRTRAGIRAIDELFHRLFGTVSAPVAEEPGAHPERGGAA